MASDTPAGVTVNWQKFALLAIALVGMLALVIFGDIEWADISAPFGLIIGYGTANGIGAARGHSPSPVFAPASTTRRAGDLDPDTPVILDGDPARSMNQE